MRWRLFLAFALVILTSVASVLLIARQGAASEVRMFMRGSMMGLDLNTLAADLEAYYREYGTWEGAGDLLASAVQGHGMGQGMMGGGGLQVKLADADGVVVAASRGKTAGKLTSAERQAAVVLHGPLGARIGYLLAEGGAAGSPYSERQLMDRLVRAGLIAAAISGALALALAVWFSYRLLKPVEALTRAAVRMAAGDLSQRVNDRGTDELATLGRAFNHMAASLQRAEQNRRSMTADIAHELRTPIAVQRAHLEALQDGVYPLTAENLQPVLDQTDSLTRLVEDLRTLALADAGELRLERAPASLADLVQRVVERFRPEAENRQIRLEQNNLAEGGDLILSIDAGRVEQILNNLISNALRYAPEAGEVRVALLRKDGWAEVRVADNGPGIPPEALPRLFERFFRADSSRSRAAGGTGLGLAISRQLALAHGGDLTAANQPQGGAVFTLRLPLREP